MSGQVSRTFFDPYSATMYSAPCILLDVADVLSAKIFDSIPVFFKKERHALHLKDKLLSLFSLVSHRLFFTLIFCFIESQVLHPL